MIITVPDYAATRGCSTSNVYDHLKKEKYKGFYDAEGRIELNDEVVGMLNKDIKLKSFGYNPE